MSSISVIVPSWRRPAELARCLRAIAAQTLRPAEVVVGARADDRETIDAVARLARERSLPATCATTTDEGVVAAMDAALAKCRGDLIALTDDDTEPRPDWLARLERCFDDPRVGGAGGRDWQPHERGDRAEVGRVQWFGRVVGNHHLGAGPARAVDVLKGANCAFRAPLLRAVGFDRRLRGSGAQLHWELSLCLALRRAGWSLVYDPAIGVEHHVAPRHGEDQGHRGVFSAKPHREAVYNQTLVLYEHLSFAKRFVFIVWANFVGTRAEPGLLQLARLLVTGERHAVARWWATLTGRLAGRREWWFGDRRTLNVPHPPA